MAAGLMVAVVDAIMNGPEGGTPASLTMAGLDPNDPSEILAPMFSERALQYWPETISDSIEVGWDFKNLPGASHALAQWTSNGGRTISFDIQLSRYMMPVSTRSAKETLLATLSDPSSSNPVDNRRYNVDIVEQISFLRGFCYPTYKDIGGVTSALPPPIMMLNIPKFELGETGSDIIYCVMTGCDVTISLAFRDGTPRRATVSVTLRQIVQTKDGIKFVGYGDGAPDKHILLSPGDREGLSKSAGRPINNMKP